MHWLIDSIPDHFWTEVYSWGFLDPNMGGALSNIGGGEQRRRQDIASGLTPFQWSQPKIWGAGAPPPNLQVGNPMPDVDSTSTLNVSQMCVCAQPNTSIRATRSRQRRAGGKWRPASRASASSGRRRSLSARTSCSRHARRFASIALLASATAPPTLYLPARAHKARYTKPAPWPPQ